MRVWQSIALEVLGYCKPVTCTAGRAGGCFCVCMARSSGLGSISRGLQTNTVLSTGLFNVQCLPVGLVVTYNTQPLALFPGHPRLDSEAHTLLLIVFRSICCCPLTVFRLEPLHSAMGRLPENVYDEFVARRAGILRALTTDVSCPYADALPVYPFTVVSERSVAVMGCR